MLRYAAHLRCRSGSGTRRTGIPWTRPRVPPVGSCSGPSNWIKSRTFSIGFPVGGVAGCFPDEIQRMNLPVGGADCSVSRSFPAIGVNRKGWRWVQGGATCAAGPASLPSEIQMDPCQGMVTRLGQGQLPSNRSAAIRTRLPCMGCPCRNATDNHPACNPVRTIFPPSPSGLRPTTAAGDRGSGDGLRRCRSRAARPNRRGWRRR